MPSFMPSFRLSSLSRREVVLLALALVAVLVAASLAYFLYQQIRVVNLEEQAATRAAADVAKAENPFKVDNPLSEIEINPLTKVKAVLNPFEQ